MIRLIRLPFSAISILGAVISIKDTGSYNRYMFFAISWCLFLIGYTYDSSHWILESHTQTMQMPLFEFRSFMLFAIAEALLCFFLSACYFIQSKNRFEQEGLLKFIFFHLFACCLLLLGFLCQHQPNNFLVKTAPFLLFFGTYAKLGLFPFHKFSADFFESSSPKILLSYFLIVLSSYTVFAFSLYPSFFKNFSQFEGLKQACAYAGVVMGILYLTAQSDSKRILSYAYSAGMVLLMKFYL